MAAVPSIPGALSPAVAAQPGTETLWVMVNSGLTTVDHQGVVQPVLAEAAPTVENGLWKVSPDGRMEITWTIREGTQWHDGTPFTSADIVFTRRVEQDREIGLLVDRPYTWLDSVVTLDARTVTTHWRAPFIYANLVFGYDGERPILPLPKQLLEKHLDEPANFTKLPYWTGEFVGTGPYKLKEWVEGSHAVLQANDHYVLGRPKIGEIEVRFLPDRTALVANMVAGAVDVNLGPGLELPEARHILERVEGAKAAMAVSGAFGAYPQFVNPDPPVLLNLPLRQALYHAVDRQEMINNLYFGQSTVAHSFVQDAEPDFRDIDRVTVKHPYDPRRAAQLIEQMGYQKGLEGFYRDLAGGRLAIELRTARGTDEVMRSLASYWKRIGVNVNEVTFPPELERDLEYRAQFPGLEVARRGNYRWDLPRALGSRGAPLPENGFSGANRGRYQNFELDALIDRYGATIPLSKRTELLGQIVQHITERVVVLWLFHGVDTTVYSRNLRNVSGRHERSTQVWNIHEWEMR